MARADAADRFLVVIPAYNEAVHIASVIRDVRRATAAAADVLVVSDGSTDGTAGAARAAGARVLELPVNSGYGMALRAGYAYALERDYPLVVQLDGDGQHDPASIPALIEPIRNAEARAVIGSRFLGTCDYRIPWTRRAGQRLFSYLLRLITGRQITDPTSGYQALHRDVLRLYTSDAFPADYPDTDVLLLLHYSGVTFCEVPAAFHGRLKGASMHTGWRPFYYIYKMFLSMFIVTFRHILAHRHPKETP